MHRKMWTLAVVSLLCSMVVVHCSKSSDNEQLDTYQPSITQYGLLTPDTFVQGDYPLDAVVDESRQMIYVVNRDEQLGNVFTGSVSFVTLEGKVITNVSVGSEPIGLTQTESGLIYVANSASYDVSVLDPSTMKVVKTLELPTDFKPLDIDQDTVNGKSYVFILGADRVKEYDESSGQFSGQDYVTHHNPRDLVVFHSEDYLFVTDNNVTGDYVTIIDLIDHSSEISGTVYPDQSRMVIDEINKKAYLLGTHFAVPIQPVVSIITFLGRGAGEDFSYEAHFFSSDFTVEDIEVDGKNQKLYLVGSKTISGEGSQIAVVDEYDASADDMPLLTTYRLNYNNTNVQLNNCKWDNASQKLWLSFNHRVSNVAGWGVVDTLSGSMVMRSLNTPAKVFEVIVTSVSPNNAYFVHPLDDSVTIIRGSDYHETNTVLGIFPYKMVIDRDRDRLYTVSSQNKFGGVAGSGIICKMDLNSREVTNIDVGSTAIDLELDQTSGKIYTGNLYLSLYADSYYDTQSGAVEIRNTSITHEWLFNAFWPLSLAVDQGKKLYVMSHDKTTGRDGVAIVDLGSDATICLNREIAPNLTDITCSQNIDAAYVTSEDNDSLVQFDPRPGYNCDDTHELSWVSTGDKPVVTLVDDENYLLFIGNYNSGSITVYDLLDLKDEQGYHTPLKTIDISTSVTQKAHPVAMVIDRTTNYLYVANEMETYISVIDISSLQLIKNLENVTSLLHQMVDLAIEDSVNPPRLHVIHNEYVSGYYKTQGWLTTIELTEPYRMAHRQFGKRLSDVIVDEKRAEVIVSDAETGSIFILSSEPNYEQN